MTGLIWLVVIGRAGWTAYKNLPAIRANDGSMLREFVRSANERLPEHGVIAFCAIHTSTGLSRRTCGNREDGSTSCQTRTDAVRRLPKALTRSSPTVAGAGRGGSSLNYLKVFI